MELLGLIISIMPDGVVGEPVVEGDNICPFSPVATNKSNLIYFFNLTDYSKALVEISSHLHRLSLEGGFSKYYYYYPWEEQRCLAGAEDGPPSPRF